MVTARVLVGLTALGILIAGAQPSYGQATNLDFELPSLDIADAPFGWSRSGWGDYDVVLDTLAYQGTYSARITRLDRDEPPRRPGVVFQTISADSHLGGRVRLTGYIRTDEVSGGYAGLFLRVDAADGRVLAMDNMHERGASGTTGWTRYQAEVAVPCEAETIMLAGLLAAERGTAWIDGLELEVLHGFEDDPGC